MIKYGTVIGTLAGDKKDNIVVLFPIFVGVKKRFIL